MVMDPNQMPGNAYDQARRSVESLGPADRLRLIAELTGKLSGQLDSGKKRSLGELQGLGKSVWQGIDVNEYLRRERASWSG